MLTGVQQTNGKQRADGVGGGGKKFTEKRKWVSGGWGDDALETGHTEEIKGFSASSRTSSFWSSSQ